MDKHRINELGLRYVESLTLYEEFASRIRNLIQDLVELENIEFYAIEGWAESPASLLHLLASLEENDLAGVDLVRVRVLLRFPEDVLKVEQLISSEFEVEPSRSLPSSSEALNDPQRFGYPAVVYILGLNESRSHLREWRKYRDLSFRLELRTLLQEAWASILPRVRHSAAGLDERKLTRELNLLSGLLEKADDGFLTLRKVIHDEELLVPQKPKPEPSEVPEAEKLFTDEELYRLFREDNTLLTRLNELALSAGFPEFSPSAEYLRESFGHMCIILREAGIDTLSEVKAFLAEAFTDDKGLNQLRAVHNTFRENTSWRADPFSVIFLLVLNFRWDILKDKDLAGLGIKRGSDRISGKD